MATEQKPLDMAAFEYRQAQEIQHVFAEHGVRYLFLGKSGAILLGFPDTTQDETFMLTNRLRTVARSYPRFMILVSN